MQNGGIYETQEHKDLHLSHSTYLNIIVFYDLQ